MDKRDSSYQWVGRIFQEGDDNSYFYVFNAACLDVNAGN